MDKPTIAGGYILLSRKLLDSDIMTRPPLYLQVWIYLLLRAQHSQYNGLQRGQLRTSIPELQDAFSYRVGFRTERPSKKQIWSVLEWLRNPDERNANGTRRVPMIATAKGTHGLLITIVNYDVYQTPSSYEGNTEGNDERDMNGIRTERGGNNINKNDTRTKKKEGDICPTRSPKTTPKVPKVPKVVYAEAVEMTEPEYAKLVEAHGEADTLRMIDILNDYKLASGRQYRSDYHAIHSWVIKRLGEDKAKSTWTSRRGRRDKEQPKELVITEDNVALYSLPELTPEQVQQIERLQTGNSKGRLVK